MVKVLFAGDVGGKVEVLFKRVETVNASAAGPFDVLLCAGGFFAGSGEHLAAGAICTCLPLCAL
jgi:hypothetical protein